jgi:protein-S-isoprenylcysteine O-methyltransferase Ste14
MAYIPLVEEHDLIERFGEEYKEYTQHVPRWMPRLTPWEGGEGAEEH